MDRGPMTEAMYYILLALQHPGHGYGMMQRIKELSGGRLVMGPGTLYGVLSRMLEDGWIVFAGAEGRRKNYAITAAGRDALLLEYDRLKMLVADGSVLETGIAPGEDHGSEDGHGPEEDHGLEKGHGPEEEPK